MTAPSTGTLPLSAECGLAARSGYTDLHRECRQPEDVPLPHTRGIWLVRRCGCLCHANCQNSTQVARSSQTTK